MYQVTQDSAYLEAACEGIAYEDSVFSKVASNWPDFRLVAKSADRPEFPVSWCHGATGIGLARLGGWSVLATDTIYKKNIEVALQSTLRHGGIGADNLCCGNFGKIEMLLVASQKLFRPNLQGMAQQQAAWVVAKAEQTSGYQLFANLPNSVFNPSFFQGTAGIGYQLLRFASPESLPSILLWE